MFRCDTCKRIVAGRQYEIVVEYRTKTYPVRRDANRFRRRRKDRPDWHSWKPGWWATDDPGGTGREIVRTKRVCADCFRAPEAQPTALF